MVIETLNKAKAYLQGEYTELERSSVNLAIRKYGHTAIFTIGSTMNNRIKNLLEIAAYSIIENIKENLHNQFEDGVKITYSTVETLIKSTTKTALSENEWHINRALLEIVKEQIDIDDLLEEYSHEEE